MSLISGPGFSYLTLAESEDTSALRWQKKDKQVTDNWSELDYQYTSRYADLFDKYSQVFSDSTGFLWITSTEENSQSVD